MNKKNIEFTEEDLKRLNAEFFGMYEDYPYDENINSENVTEYAVIFSDRHIEAPHILRKIYHILQKFMHLFGSKDKPMGIGWQEFIGEYMNRYSESDDEAYEMMCEHAKLYAQKLREHRVITEEEESHLFDGELIKI